MARGSLRMGWEMSNRTLRLTSTAGRCGEWLQTAAFFECRSKPARTPRQQARGELRAIK